MPASHHRRPVRSLHLSEPRAAIGHVACGFIHLRVVGAGQRAVPVGVETFLQMVLNISLRLIGLQA